MIENISKKQEKIQEKIQKQQEMNDKDCRELTDEELEQVVGGMPKRRDEVYLDVTPLQLGTVQVALKDAQVATMQLVAQEELRRRR